ncbi:hypothetical protein [Streptomyces hoynatensis]|uniref:Uncharacterized protein n=1 Tax=Streptomyces hoynatensis TaxID=1141874 RepID=A0A3A9YN63_9ACTN|nr:hypothetical protein [Streptomyces hoynatensis]RKN37509.1 hypothetical protein D7294_27610 [Streptomyces hoynatensis]
MKSLGLLLAVSLVALAAVIGYRSGREAERKAAWEPIADRMEDAGTALAGEFRARAGSSAGRAARGVQWICVSLDPQGLPLVVVVTDARPEGTEADQLLADIRDFLAQRHGADFARGHSDMLLTSEGEVVRDLPAATLDPHPRAAAADPRRIVPSSL